MIRVGLPAPLIFRLRLRAQLTADRVARQASSLRQGVLTTIRNDISVLRRTPHVLGEEQATAADVVELLPAFEEHYQELVDLLCWSAKDGIHTGRDSCYSELRSWFLAHYAPLRPMLLRHLDSVPAEDCVCSSGEMPGSRDAFESLFVPIGIDAIINSETVISRIIRTRVALDALRDEVDGR